MRKRKIVHISLAVSVPVDMSAAEARKEVRTLINHQANWSAEPEDVKVRRCVAAPRVYRARPQKYCY